MKHLGVLLGVVTLLQVSAAGAAEWPDRPITVIVNYAAGGSTDVAARTLASAVSDILKVPVVVENRPGAQGTLGPTAIAGAKPDGNTIGFLGSPPLTIAPHMMDVRYSIDSFSYLGAFGRHRFGVAVRSESPIKSFADLIAAAKASRVTYGAAGPPNNLPLHDLAKRVGGEFQFIPFPSGAEAATAVLGGHIDAVLQTPSELLEFIKSGRMRLIVSVSPVRWVEMPEVPTLIEQGYDISIDSLIGVGGPAGIEADRLEKLRNAFAEAAASPAVRSKFASFAMEPVKMSGPEYEMFLRAELPRMRPALEAVGLAKPKS